MSRTKSLRLLASLAVAGVALVAAGWQEKPKDASKPKPAAATRPAEPKEPAEATEIRASAAAFLKAFESGNAKAVAAFWTENGEYVDPDGQVVRGREAIEKLYTQFFKAHPKSKLSSEVHFIRVIGKNVATEQGTMRLQGGGPNEASTGFYSALHVREADGWKMASVKEWIPSPNELLTPRDLEWLIGDWTAKSGDIEVKTSCTWDENKVFLVEKYTQLEKGEKLTSGKQVIGRNPGGGLRSFLFHDHGEFGESHWEKDGHHWVVISSATLADGSVMTATNVLIPIDNNTFTWQSMNRMVGDAPLPDVPPIRVTRVMSPARK